VKISEQRTAARISIFIVISRFGTDERDYCRSKLATGKAQQSAHIEVRWDRREKR
jgi:hypothetical protein